MACFGCYNEYFNNFEKAKHIEQTMSKTNRLFRDFVEGVKQTSPNLGNVSIRELIMEPVQRIPRYKLLLDGIIKSLPPQYSDQRARLDEAVVLCSRIASCEVDEKTQRAAVLWSFGRNVHGFPAGLFSIHRRFIDAIDVDDFPLEYMSGNGAGSMFSPSSSQNSKAIPCTLFLFDDSIVVAKRANSSSSGRQILALNDLNRLADEMKTFTERSGAAANQIKKPELGFRGVIDIADIVATDLGGPDLQLHFKTALAHIHHEKWSGRPVRQYSTMSDPNNGFPARMDKMRFLENLWRSQALQKTRDDKSQARVTVVAASSTSPEDSPVMDAEPRRIIYWNVYGATSTYLAEPVKNGAVLLVDAGRTGNTIGLGPDQLAPHAQLRILSIDEEYSECSYSVRAKGRRPDEDVYVLSLSDLGTKMRKLHDSAVIQEDPANALMNFRPGVGPSTPSSHRGRVVAGLENLGRSLFNGTPGSIRSVDVFGSPRRKGSILSKSSMASTMASDLFSTSGRSVSTAGTSINSRDMLSMQPTAAAVDTQGKLLPPGSGSPASPRQSRTRAQSAGPMEMMYSHAEEETILDPQQQQQDVTPRRSADETAATGSARQRARSVMSPYEVEAQLGGSWQQSSPSAARSSMAGRPLGPRVLNNAVLGGTPGGKEEKSGSLAVDHSDSQSAAPSSARRKPVPFPSSAQDVPYTPTRRVVSGSKRRAPEGEEEGDLDGSYSPSRRHSSKRTAPPTPPKDRQPVTQPLRVRSDNIRAAAPRQVERSSQGLKSRVRRNLARLDTSDKENSDSLGLLADELSELQGVATEYTSSVLGDLTSRLEAWLSDASDRCVDNKSVIDRVVGDVEAVLTRLEEAERDAKDAREVAESLTAADVQSSNQGPGSCSLTHIEDAELEDLKKKAKEHKVFKTRVDALQRKCELLTALESDGRLENAELHKVSDRDEIFDEQARRWC